jgi:hypothetical protein
MTINFNQTYLVSYQGRYLEIDAETIDDARELAFMRFNAKSINDVEIYLADVEYDPYYF